MIEPTRSQITTYIESAAARVWRELGAGHDEAIYRTALALALSEEQLLVKEEVPIPVYFGETCVGVGRADIVVYAKMVLELKTTASLNDAHRAQLQAYLRGLHVARGALINFPSKGGDLSLEWVNHPKLSALSISLSENT